MKPFGDFLLFLFAFLLVIFVITNDPSKPLTDANGNSVSYHQIAPLKLLDAVNKTQDCFPEK